MVRECKSRPVNMTVAEWCAANSITPANYYYRMTEVRKAFLDTIPDGNPSPTIVPVSMDLLTANEKNNSQASEGTVVELVSNGITVRVTDETSTELLTKVLGVIAHVK